MADVEIPSPVERSPEAHITLDRKMLSTARNLKPGARVKLTLVGTLKELNERVGDPEGVSGDSGSMTVQLTELKALQNSDIAELFEDEFGG